MVGDLNSVRVSAGRGLNSFLRTSSHLHGAEMDGSWEERLPDLQVQSDASKIRPEPKLSSCATRSLLLGEFFAAAHLSLQPSYESEYEPARPHK